VAGPLKTHGGKHYLASRIVALMPRHLHYVEPYAGGLSVLLARSLTNLGTLLRDMGKRAEARVLLEEALGISRKALPPLHPDLATSLNNLGASLQEMGKHGEARPLLEESLAICRKALPPLHPNLAASLTNLGTLLRDMGKHGEARPVLEESLAISRKALPPPPPLSRRKPEQPGRAGVGRGPIRRGLRAAGGGEGHGVSGG
jgi:tetratricopeptide (TPR) repeat protein